MTIFSDLFAIVKHGGIALDEEEAAMLGAPSGETLSLWTAMEARHGVWLAHVACLAYSMLRPPEPHMWTTRLSASFNVLLFSPEQIHRA